MKSLKKFRLHNVLYLALIVFLFTACADTASIESCVTVEYGFLSGLWHGIVSPISFFGSLLSDDIAMYAVNNNGGWYDFGFVLGASILFGGSSKSSK